MSKKQQKMSPEQIQTVARMFKVLGEPTRLMILRLLFKKPLTVSEIVLALESKQANVSKQLGMLHGAGLVSRKRCGNQVTYAIGEPMIFELCELVCGKLQRDAVSHAKSMGVKASALR
ncbi:helix-turn-helix transcriptional regulator [bacterium AH-315-I18]|nr:helix-turn-helix transcriptional regulator [bacterium AH-315-I18]